MNLQNAHLTTSEIRKKSSILLKKMNDGSRKARLELIELNLPLVVYIASKYRDLADFDDLIQEGAIGLIRAIDCYAKEQETSFSTYLYYSIVRSITTEIYRQRSSMLVKPRTASKIDKLLKDIDILESRLNRNATLEEIATYTGYSQKLVDKMLTFKRREKSLYDLVINDSDFSDSTYLINTLIDEDAPCVIDEVLNNEALDYLKSLLDNSELNERAIKIFTQRNDLDGCGKRSLTEVGEEFGITNSRVSMIDKAVKKKLKLKYNY